MSKLLGKLEKLSEGRSQPIGFEAARAREKLHNMLLLAKLPIGDEKLIATTINEHVDALVFPLENIKKEKQALSQRINDLNDIPWGIVSSNITKDMMQLLLEMRCDFVILTPESTPAYILREDNIGKVLQLDPSLDLELIRTIPRLSINAVLLNPGNQVKYPLTIYQIMLFERMVGGTGKHILATMSTDMPVDDIEDVWNLGARGIVVEITNENYKDRLPQVKEAIHKLPSTRKKPKEKYSPVLPHMAVQPSVEEPDEDDDI